MPCNPIYCPLPSQIPSESACPLSRRPARSAEIVLCWDEQNRLMGVADNNYLSLYQYDANGDRTYKLTGKTGMQNVNGGWQCFYQMENATLYASPYLVATPRGYTKHYYAESERVASRIGGGGLHGLTMTGKDDFQELLQPELPLHHPSCIPNNDEFKKKCDNATKYAIEVARCLDSEIRAYAPLENLAPFSDILNEKPDCYWYHPDHLGSSSWITSSHGEAVQHLHYLPWGEEFVNQRTSDFSARYTFSAKEKDAETGYSYFGSRYYSSDLSIWLSVDPKSDKYPCVSPYVYCANNPIKLVDPDGEEVWIPGLDEKGNVTYTAENGDNFNTFIHQFDCSKEVAAAIFSKAGFGKKDGDVKAGNVIKGEDVYEITKSSQILKGNWFAMDDDHRITTVMFALQYSNFHKETNDKKNGASSVDLTRFISNFPYMDIILRYQDDKNKILLPNGQFITIHFMEIDVGKLGDPPTIQNYYTDRDVFKNADGDSFVKYKFLSGKNPNAKCPFTGILMSIPAADAKKFDPLF